MVQLAMMHDEFHAAARRLQLDGVSGRLERGGIAMRWHYVDPILAAEVERKPFWMSEEMAVYSVWFA